MSAADLALAAAILSAAAWLLYRSVWKGQGGCHGCGSGACRRSGRERTELVRIGARADGSPPAPDGSRRPGGEVPS